ncbi:MAG: aldehyde dehydrogenase [Candidatus Kapabacteria bacterium]|nr:aldehyde dehydrogenase [Candidatus Kapabacteria bacterium]MCS7170056.1 aldehyde dehydrogenase [Candidatus Kapabacteria bacterium]MDW7997078.1 aldehyde dehydrogenase [Bacteroidota bacterium]MDW8225539.1 aldehyde dehydrogenase [Bacteroidota bacterium]
MERLANFIGGQLCAPVGGQYLEKREPATGEVIALVPASDARDLEQAVAVARAAFPSWAATSVEERSRFLVRIADLIEAHMEELAWAESRDTGKPLWLAQQVDIPRAVRNFRFFAAGLLHFASEAYQTDSQAFSYTLRQPLGIVGCIAPWNLPLYLLTWKVAPALATGNCVIAKPSELTPTTAQMLARLTVEAGLPPGVFNVVQGEGPAVGTALVAHPEVRALSFTGGTRTGEAIARVAAPMFKKLTLELGGKNPTIIFEDCRFEVAVHEAIRAAFSNQGEICLCGSRILVQSSIYEAFRREFVARARALRVGDPLDSSTQQGALISEQHLQKVLSYVELSRQEGGTVLCGGERLWLEGRCRNGYFMAPTVVEGLAPGCKVNQEEIFGPVATLIPFDSEDEAIAYANGTAYGLAASVWTDNLGRAHRVAESLQSGVVWVNCWMLRDLRTPFGGMKHSGIGREGGWEAFRFFTEPKSVTIALWRD